MCVSSFNFELRQGKNHPIWQLTPPVKNRKNASAGPSGKGGLSVTEFVIQARRKLNFFDLRFRAATAKQLTILQWRFQR